MNVNRTLQHRALSRGLDMKAIHLIRRAIQVAVGGDLDADDERFVAEVLQPHELRLFAAATGADRVHGVRVARRILERLGDNPKWLRAALLHDTGKARARMGLVARVVVTAAATAAPVAGARWEERVSGAEAGNRLLDPVRRSWRPGAYLAHGPLAAAWLARHGTEEEVCAWVRVHHRQELWPETPLPTVVLHALAEADE